VHEVGSAWDLPAAVQSALPDDQIVLADGQWLDAALDVTCSGTADAPIDIYGDYCHVTDCAIVKLQPDRPRAPLYVGGHP
jgi:hypothetical protein